MAEVIDLSTYIERAVKAKKSPAEREKFSEWAWRHLEDVTNRLRCDLTHPETQLGFRAGAQWALDLQEKHEKDTLAALHPRWGRVFNR
jgi:hypothetical protein